MSSNFLTSVTTAEVMGTVVSVHVVSVHVVSDAGTGGAGMIDTGSAQPGQGAVELFLAGMHQDETVFSPFRETSAISQLRAGKLSLADAPPEVREVETTCRAAFEITEGRFDAWHQGWFNPTGYVKGWSVERNFVRNLAPLIDCVGTGGGAGGTGISNTSVFGAGAGSIVAVGANCGGDLRVITRPGVDWTWKTGIVNPFDNQQVIAKFELTNGAVATSGPAERGAHIVNPFTNLPALGVASATVVADTLDRADLWATTAVVAGFDDLRWLVPAHTQSGLIIASDLDAQGYLQTKRWAGIAELVET